MPILALFRWRADPAALVAAYDREMEDAPSVTLDQPRRSLHVFARGEDGGPRPVTRIVVITDGDRREIRSYGPDGEFLTATHQIAE